MKTIFISLFISSFLIFSFNAHKHNCIHHELNYTVRHLNTSSGSDKPSQGRSLQQTFDSIRIYVDYTNLVTGSEAVIEYIKNQLMASAVAYFEATLKVPRLTSPLIVDGACGTLNPPDMLLTTGVEADLVILVTSEYNTDADYVAYSIPCSLDWDTNRPTYGMLSINLATLETAQLVQLSDNLYTVLHEMTHLLGFSQNLYQYYIDPSTNELLDNVIGTTTANGQTINYINVEPLTTRVREHFGCDTAPGGYLENNGGSGSAGSHWERRVFYNEYMTANDILDSRVSEFTLALLEGTGWYQVNYNNSEPLQWGQSGGCSFLDGACMNDKTFEPNFNEFCSPLTAEGCSYTGRAVAVCGSGTQISTDSSLPSSENYWGNDTVVVDSFSDNCPYYIGLPNADCENPADAAFAYLQQEFYGQGSRCFAGTLSPAGFYFAQTVAFCFPVKCNTADDGSNIVTVTIGDTVVNCTEEKTVSVSGMTGVLQCPDPDTFCTISNPEYCRVGCSGHGTCVDNICQCPEGWTGPDCSAREYVDSCTRCANETENTSCFGDLCACNPNATNSTCPNSLLIGTGDGTYIDNMSGEAIVNPTGSGANYRYKMSGASRLSTTAAIIASFFAIFFILF